MKKVVVVGLGHQMSKDHMPAIALRKDLEIAAVVDSDAAIAKDVGTEIGSPWFTSLSDIKFLNDIDLAVVCVPHNQYLPILKILAKNKIATLKEKPFALSNTEAREIVELYRENDTYLQICVQRRFSRLYETVDALARKIGEIYSLHAEYTLNLREVTGWRADKSVAGGAAALDMGYHTIDLLTDIFGRPDRLYAQLNYKSIAGNYTTDDSAKVLLAYNQGKINADIFITSIADKKSECIFISGSEGVLAVEGRKASLLDRNGDEIESHVFSQKGREMEAQLNYFVVNSTSGFHENILLRGQLLDMKIISAIYESAERGKVVKF